MGSGQGDCIEMEASAGVFHVGKKWQFSAARLYAGPRVVMAKTRPTIGSLFSSGQGALRSADKTICIQSTGPGQVH